MLNMIIKYSLFFPIIIYFFGFLYVQGLVSPFTQNSAASLFSLIRTYPISPQLYLINGIALTVKMLMPFSLGFLLIRFIKLILDKNSDMNSFIKEKVIRPFPEPSILIFTLLPYLFFLIVVFFTGRLISANWYELTIESVLIFSILLPFEVVKFAMTCQFNRYTKQSYKLIYLVLTVIILMIFSYSEGVLTQINKLTQYETNNSFFEGAKVYTAGNNNEYKSYLQFDISSDFFIGWSLNDGSITVIPMDKIQRIESFDIKKSESHVKFVKDITVKKSEEYNISKTITEYYKYRTEQYNATNVISLMTTSYFKRKFNMASSQILQKIWEETKKYNDNDISSFYGYDMSIPEHSEASASNTYVVYVVEYWKDSPKYIKYTFSDKSDLIDNIEILPLSFEFNKSIPIIHQPLSFFSDLTHTKLDSTAVN